MTELAGDPLSGAIRDMARMLVWLLLLAIVFVPLEKAFAVRPAPLLRKGLATDLGYYFLSGLVPAVLLALPLAALAWGSLQLLPAGYLAWVAAQPVWLLLPIALLVGDIGGYWGHRLSHELPFLWRFHAVHHSAPQVDWLVNTRAHPVDLVVTRLFAIAPVYALGLAQPTGSGTLLPALVAVIGTLWSFLVHANVRVRLGPLERLLATPFFHHWHHTRRDHVDHNYAAMFPFVDKLFGTLWLPREWPAEYGTDTEVGDGLGAQLVRPFMPPAGQARPAE